MRDNFPQAMKASEPVQVYSYVYFKQFVNIIITFKVGHSWPVPIQNLTSEIYESILDIW
jgi:hypothetical protein